MEKKSSPQREFGPEPANDRSPLRIHGLADCDMSSHCVSSSIEPQLITVLVTDVSRVPLMKIRT